MQSWEVKWRESICSVLPELQITVCTDKLVGFLLFLLSLRWTSRRLKVFPRTRQHLVKTVCVVLPNFRSASFISGLKYFFVGPPCPLSTVYIVLSHNSKLLPTENTGLYSGQFEIPIMTHLALGQMSPVALLIARNHIQGGSRWLSISHTMKNKRYCHRSSKKRDKNGAQKLHSTP